MRRMIPAVAAAAALAASAGVAHAAATLEFLDNVLGAAISADGTVIVGNTSDQYETFRWTEATGVVTLGRATLPAIGVAAGVPDVSDDGTRISATILGADSTYATQGVWTMGTGWQELMPPLPPHGGLIDQSYGSAWCISGDGNVVGGLYWRPGQPDGSAHATSWTDGGGVTDLGSNGHDSRANACDADGNVVVGWASIADGTWQPTAWVDGVLTTLEATAGFCEAHAVTPGGTTILGSTYDPTTFKFAAAAWDRDGASWMKRVLGALPGTAANTGYVAPNDCTPDGRLVVGFNQFFWGNSTGFVWTEELGMVDIVPFAASRGAPFPAGFDVLGLNAVSDDGSVLVGTGRSTVPPFAQRTFILRLDHGVSAPEIAAVDAREVSLRAWPNPTRGGVTIDFGLPRAGAGTIGVYDVTGRRVRQLASGTIPSGPRTIAWDARDGAGAKVGAGVYYLRLDAGDARGVETLVVVR